MALNRQFRNTFAIVDGMVGMEGNGPIQGTPKPAGVLVMGRDLVAVDSTCCRIMGIDPEKVEYLRLAADLGHVHPERIDQRGETIASVHTNFALIDEFNKLRWLRMDAATCELAQALAHVEACSQGMALRYLARDSCSPG